MTKAFVFAVAAAAIWAGAQARAQDYFQPSGPAANFGGLEAGAQFGAAIGGTGDVSTTGFGFGGYAGYNLQNGPIVGGLEADTLLSSINGDGAGGRLSQNWITSARVRGGWTFGNVLAYGTIGPAFASSSYEAGGFTYDKQLHGFVFGAGGEIAITRQFTARAEVRHYDFGDATYYMPHGAQRLSTGNNMLLIGLGAHF